MKDPAIQALIDARAIVAGAIAQRTASLRTRYGADRVE